MDGKISADAKKEEGNSMNNLSGDSNTNKNPYGGNPDEGTSYGGNPQQSSYVPAQNGNAKKGMGKGLKAVIIIVIVLWVLGLGVFGFFMFRMFKLASTPKEALSASEFTEAVEELGYEASDSLEEEFVDSLVYTGNKGRTILIFGEFGSKRDAQGYFEELLDFYNADSSSSSVLINGVNFMIRRWSKAGVYYYAEIVDGTVVFVTTEDKEELAEIMEVLRP